MSNTILVTGGARSGKSRLALQLAADSLNKVFVATAEPFDLEMELRISRHRIERGEHWKTIEEPVSIASAIRAHRDSVVLIDCLTLWISNLMMRHSEDSAILAYFSELANALQSRVELTILVTNEVGLGIVPENDASRRFRDLAGTLNQNIAALSATVILCVSGLPLYLKDERTTHENS